MRIAFLCSSLAEGKDGVGDYVRLLASSCESDGHECILIALNDRHLAGSAPEGVAGIFRFPAALSWPSRAARLRELLADFAPDWVSWQIVSYGFSPRGILPMQIELAVKAASGWRRHVMLHELWLGIARNEGVRARLLGALQRHHIGGLLRKLRPERLHTSNAAYQRALQGIGWDSGVLPLFGNIPIVPGPADSGAALGGYALGPLPDAGVAVGVLFGTLHPQWKVEDTLQWLEKASRASGRRIVLLAVGRSGAHAAAMLTRLNEGGRITAASLGELPPERISAVIQAADFGIATHPWALIGKSGTTATLLEHGLPVVVPRDDWQLRSGPTPGPENPLLARMAGLLPRDFPAFLGRRREPEAKLPEISARFCAELAGQPIPA